MTTLALLILLAAPAASAFDPMPFTGGEPLRSAAAIKAALADQPGRQMFDITVRITASLGTGKTSVTAEDETGRVLLENVQIGGESGCNPGDTVRLSGAGSHYPDRTGFTLSANKMEVLSRGPAPAPVQTDISSLQTGRHDQSPVTFQGYVTDAFSDEITRICRILSVTDGTNSIYIAFVEDDCPTDKLQSLIGARIAVRGICSSQQSSRRKRLKRSIRNTGLADLTILEPPPADPFTAFGRQRIVGRVIAIERENRIHLRTVEGETSRVDLATDDTPDFGTVIEAAGNPETDLYNLNLSRAIWRPASADIPSDDPPLAITADRIFNGGGGVTNSIDTVLHGRAVTLEGIVRGNPAADMLFLDCGAHMLPVDATSVPSCLDTVTDSCRVAVTGTCIMKAGNWHPDGPFPHIEGISIVLRTASDLTVLERPPWWTARRLAALAGALAVLMGITLCWTVLLKRLAERRGQELAEERNMRFQTAFRTDERTRLAIELHDSIAQNLSGASMQIDAARKFHGKDELRTDRYLDLSSSTLQACRSELRNCIWDLRNLAWEEKDLNSAVRKTVAAMIGDTDLTVRFNVSRERLTDGVAHAVLRIIRELVSNAIRHGHARKVVIAGCLDGDRVLFSVRDDGCGFDPASAPGAQQGHFGLSGIRERVRRLKGEIDITSAPGKGTKATVTL